MKKQTPNFTKHPKHKVAPFVQGGKLVGPEEVKGQFSCHIMHIDSNKAFEPHIHPSSHLLIVLEGTGFLDTWHGELKIRKQFKMGDVLVVQPNTKHASGAGRHGTRFIVVDVPGTSLHDDQRIQYTKQ